MDQFSFPAHPYSETDLLFAMPSFHEGMARIFDFGNTLPQYNFSESGEMADYRALQGDVNTVAGDLSESLKR